MPAIRKWALAVAFIGGVGIAASQALPGAAARQRAKAAGAIEPAGLAVLAMVQAGPGGCYPAVSASGESLVQSQAQAAAIDAWRSAAAAVGSPANYNHARSKSMTCERRPPLRRWNCAVTAQPCISGGAGNPDPNPACHPQVIATGPWRRLRSTAENQARDQWQHDAGNAYGTNYKWWQKSRNRSISCSHDGQRPRDWQCRATAEPCL